MTGQASSQTPHKSIWVAKPSDEYRLICKTPKSSVFDSADAPPCLHVIQAGGFGLWKADITEIANGDPFRRLNLSLFGLSGGPVFDEAKGDPIFSGVLYNPLQFSGDADLDKRIPALFANPGWDPLYHEHQVLPHFIRQRDGRHFHSAITQCAFHDGFLLL